MNPRQKHVLLVGIVLVGLAAIYPPWNLVDQYFSYSRLEVERFAGYSFFFAPPSPDPPPRDRPQPTATVSRIDTRRLAVEWVGIVLVVTGLLFLLRSQAVSPRRPEGPPAGPNAATGKATGSVAAHPDANASTGPPSLASKPSGDRPSPFPKIDLEMIGDLLYIAGYYVEGGIREFGKWSKALINRFGKGGPPLGRSRKPFEKPPTEQSTKRFGTLSEQDLLEVRKALEDDQRLRQQFLQEPRLESRPPRASEPTKSPLVDPGSTEAQRTSSHDGHPPANVSTNLPNETAKPSERIEKLPEFIWNADPQKFNATTAAILRGLKMKPVKKEDAYCWIVENRHRFAGLVFGDDQPRTRFEVAMVACVKRQMADVEKHFRSIAGQRMEVASVKREPLPHWALKDLSENDLAKYLPELEKLGLLAGLSDDLEPVAYFNPQNPRRGSRGRSSRAYRRDSPRSTRS